MQPTLQKLAIEAPLSNTRHLSELKFEDRSMPGSEASSDAEIKIEGLQTDMVMLQKADVWISQFKTRLNFGIIALVVLWGGVAFYKSHELRLAARSAPEVESFVADGSMDDSLELQTLEVDNLQRPAPAEAMATDELEKIVPVKATKPAPGKTVKKTVAQKTLKSNAMVGRNSSKTQKKSKKSMAVTPAR